MFISSWEFATTLDYEWNIIRRHRPFRWTVWVRVNALFLLGFAAQILSRAVWQVYSTTRISTLVAVILVLVGVDVTVPSNCVVRMFIYVICGCDLIVHDLKLETMFQLVSKPSGLRLRCT